MDIHDITRGNILECVLRAGSFLGQAAEFDGMERVMLLADAQQIAEALAPLDPVAATVIREGVHRVLHPPDDVIEQSPLERDIKPPREQIDRTT